MVKKKEEKVVDAIVEDEKTYFLPRAFAYVIDCILVFVICLGINMALPKNENHEKYMEESNQIQQDYKDKKIKEKEYINRVKEVTYDLDYTNVTGMLVNVTVLILYFGAFQYYNNGKTLGKKITKLRIINTEGKELSLNQIVIRALIINSIFINICTIGTVLFIGRSNYYYASTSLKLIDSLIVLVSLGMILFRKDGKGIHDLIAKTKVINDK